MQNSKITAVLGPTNTGKTYYAIERMLGYQSGVMGFPLRLLAREVFDKLVSIRGKNSIALVTGEERIIPKNPKYWICTVEAMPMNIGVEFVAVDEIQLCADYERGHIFTDRLLHARGSKETMLMGAETICDRLRALFPEVTVLRRERFSELNYIGRCKISKIPERAAIVSFSTNEVYAIAELIRRQKGGAAVIMGALSPRTRNAQVELYQNGDVDYLVATDAIGMGLNLDLKHISFAKLSKFDGRRERNLYSNELAQIAGRAGRYKTNGTFGVTGEAEDLESRSVQAIEKNKFSPIKVLQWRNSKLNFTSVDGLINSLEAQPENEQFVRSQEGADLKVLKNLADSSSVDSSLSSNSDIKLLWDVCQIPDFRKISEVDHSNLLMTIFNFLKNDGILPNYWLNEQIRRLDKTEGDIDTLSKRLAFIRTWTFVSYKKTWINNSENWQSEASQIEDKLSDELHRKLIQRFIDRRTSVLVKGLKQRETLVGEINQKSEIFVEGQLIGKLVGFCFETEKSTSNEENKAIRSTAIAVLGVQYRLRSDKLYNSSDQDFSFENDGKIFWNDTVVGRMESGIDILSPKIIPIIDDEASPEIAEKIKRRLEHFFNRAIELQFEPLLKMKSDDSLTGISRGLAYRLIESLGLIERDHIATDIKALDQKDRASLRKYGVRFGQFTIFHHLMLKPAPTKLRLLLWSLMSKQSCPAPGPGLVTLPADPNLSPDYYLKAGYRLMGERALRVDMLERLSDIIRKHNIWNGFEATVDMLSITGLTLEQFAGVMVNLGYSAKRDLRNKEPNATKTNDLNSKIDLKKEPFNSEGVNSFELAQIVDNEDSKIKSESKLKEITNVEESNQQEVFYVFKFKKNDKFKKIKRVETNPLKKDSLTKKLKSKIITSKIDYKGSETKRLNKSGEGFRNKKEKEIDPNNPFSILLKLKI